MNRRSFILFVLFHTCHGLWKKGIIHYTINSKDYDNQGALLHIIKRRASDYRGISIDKIFGQINKFNMRDRTVTLQWVLAHIGISGHEEGGRLTKTDVKEDLHSQDEIVTTFSKIQQETCLKFFMTPSNGSSDKILFISNPDKLKTCPPSVYDFSKSVVHMPIGYKCINQRDIARIVLDMISASIENVVSPVNSYDLFKKFQMKDEVSQSTLLSQTERDYINGHYFDECGAHTQRVSQRRSGEETSTLSDENLKYYRDKMWPLGILLYGIEDELRGTPDHNVLTHAMTTVELATYVVFQEIKNDNVLAPKNLLWFSKIGEEGPAFGVQEGNQTIKLSFMTHGAPGHTAHTINNLMRALGVHMTSNRFDRNNYVTINWRNVQKGKEDYLERAPEGSWLSQVPYDFASVTHAPANYMCDSCDLGASTVQPIQDHQWQRTLTMGHKTVLTESDIQTVNLLYNEQYRNRFGGA